MTAASRRCPVVKGSRLSKAFSGRTVLEGVDIEIHPGEVHALLGQNGSGKSTLIKILSGYHQPEPGGSLWIRGERVRLPLRPGDPHRLGLSFVHQGFGLIESATVLENLRLGGYATGHVFRISWRDERKRARQELARLGITADPETPVWCLQEVDRALITIARSLDLLAGHTHGLLVLDEPTASLPRDGVDVLFAAIRKVAEMQHGVLFVTHRLDEVFAICDRASILRDGKLVHVADVSQLSEDEVITKIVGTSLDRLYPTPQKTRATKVLAVRGLSGAGIEKTSFELRQGEILGLTGLHGMGYATVPYLLVGAERAESGELIIGSRRHELRRMSPARASMLRVALLPANRQRLGGSASATVTENVTLCTLRKYFVHGFLRRKQERRRVAQLLTAFQVSPPEPERTFATLSGGNQQKALLAKWFETEPTVLLLDEPAQGVDVGARAHIFHRLRDAAQGGLSMIIASVEYEDLAHLCDRVLVFRNGRVVSELHRKELTADRIVEQCFRAGGQSQSQMEGAGVQL